MTVYVDLVPAVVLPDFTTEAPLPLGIECNKYHLISKTSRKDFSNDTTKDFLVSYACAENAIIKAVPHEIRLGYCTAKAVRIAAICQPKDIESLYLNDSIKSDDCITSYMLKTCLINLVHRYGCVNGTRYDWAEKMYEELETCVHKGCLRSDISGEHVFQCSHALFDHTYGIPTVKMDDLCCRKHRIILALCKPIRSWLRENKADLEELTYGKQVVYSRHMPRSIVHKENSRRHSHFVQNLLANI